jgi:hypothetical protein
MPLRVSAQLMAFGKLMLKKPHCEVTHPSKRLLQVLEAVVPNSLGFVAFVLTSGSSFGVTTGRS